MQLPSPLLALSLVAAAPAALAQDCNSNGVDDAIDLVTGVSLDCNQNGIPDECDACAGDITLIDFEGFAELTQIGTQYAADGVTFGLLGEPGLPIICVEGTPNVAFSGAGADSPLAGEGGLTDPDDGSVAGIEILFDPPVNEPSLFVIDVDASDVVELRAYAGATLLETQSFSSGEEGTGNAFGTFVRFDEVDVTRLEIEFTDGGQGFAIDDLSFERVSEVTECNGFLRISQESTPGAGDFDANVLGFFEVFPTGTTVEALYSYDFPINTSYNGTLLQLQPDDSNLAFVETADAGLCLFVVHDISGDGDGGRAEMRFDLSGDPDGAELVLVDDPITQDQDQFSGDPGDSSFTARWSWQGCCTDGLVLGDLEDDFELILGFEDVNGSLATPTIDGLFDWILTSADGAQIELELEEGRRVRVDTIAGPCPLSFTPSVVDLSVSAGGAQILSLDAGAGNAGGIYFILGSISGTQPGIGLGDVVLPLNPDPYFDLTLLEPNGLLLLGQIGFLNASGQGTALFTLPPATSPSLAGLIVHHAFTLLGTPFVSNPCPARLLP